MRIFLRAAFLIIVQIITLSGCVQQPANVANNNPVNTPTPAPQSSPQMIKASAGDENSLPVTLPLLDAFFADESFSTDLKSKLQLTDEQVERLRKVARDETLSLRETDTGEYAGTTRAASTHAAEAIKAIIGDEKARQLAALLRERWGGEEGNKEESHGAAKKF